jgi:hypothetical protein
MIRKLMANCAMLALMNTGALTAAQAQDNPAKPAVVEQDATAAEPASTELAESTAALSPDRPTLISVFMGSTVYSSEDPESDNIGEINDLVVNEDGSITHAIVGVGGFLGIGEKDVAVPFDELKVVEKDGEIRLIYAATREQLEEAPALDRTAYRRLEHPADEAAAENVQPTAEPATTAETEAANSAQQETGTPATTASTSPSKDQQTAEIKMADDCSAAWVSADVNKDGTLDAEESARYLAALRVADTPLADDATLTHSIFVENCRAGYFDTVSAEVGAPFEGANSFTEGQAQDRILAAGFTNVSGLTKDDKGIWRGTAEADGKQVNVAVDYKGNVVTTNM